MQDLQESSKQKGKDGEGFAKPLAKIDKKSKSYRVHEETPTYTGGVSEEARNRLESRENRNKQRGLQTTTKVLNKHVL